MSSQIDEQNQRILEILASQGRITNTDLAKNLGIAPSAALNRVRKLEENKLILSYHAKFDYQTIGFGFLTYVLVRTNGQSTVKKIGEAFSAIPNIVEVHQTAGEYCFMLKIRTSSTKEFADLLNESIANVKGVAGTTTTITLSTFKEEMNPFQDGSSF